MTRLLSVLMFCLFPAQLLFAGTPDFALQDINGETHTLSQYRGKWVVVNYWATWCPPCRDEIPELIDFHERHKNVDAVVLGIDHEEVDREFIRDFVDSYLITYPILLSTPGHQPLGPVRGLPSTYLVSPDGRIVARKVGPVSAEDIERFIEQQHH